METKSIFKDRFNAGQRLAKKLLPLKSKHPVVLALPRGGVPVAFEVAKVLNVPLDTLVTQKISDPDNPETGVGAISDGEVIMVNNKMLKYNRLKKEDLVLSIEKAAREIEQMMYEYQSGKFSKGFSSRTVILVDDGLITGLLARAAIESIIIKYKPQKIILAVPICPHKTAEALRDFVSVVCVHEIDDFYSNVEWYGEEDKVSDEEVINLLKKANDLI